MSGEISRRCCWPNPTLQNPFLSCEEVWQDSECEVIIYLISSPNKLLHLVWVSLESGFWLDLRVDRNWWRSKLFDHLFRLSSEEMFLEVVQSRFSIPILFLEVIFFKHWQKQLIPFADILLLCIHLIHCNKMLCSVHSCFVKTVNECMIICMYVWI